MSGREYRRREARRLKREGDPQYREIPPTEWPSTSPSGMTRVFRNNEYLVLIFDRVLDPYGYRSSKVMVQNNFSKPVGLRELQKIKNAIFGSETLAAQYLPRESELVDEANMYWFYVREK